MSLIHEQNNKSSFYFIFGCLLTFVELLGFGDGGSEGDSRQGESEDSGDLHFGFELFDSENSGKFVL